MVFRKSALKGMVLRRGLEGKDKSLLNWTPTVAITVGVQGEPDHTRKQEGDPPGPLGKRPSRRGENIAGLGGMLAEEKQERLKPIGCGSTGEGGEGPSQGLRKL